MRGLKEMLRLRGGVETIKTDPWLRRQVILSVLLMPLFWYTSRLDKDLTKQDRLSNCLLCRPRSSLTHRVNPGRICSNTWVSKKFRKPFIWFYHPFPRYLESSRHQSWYCRHTRRHEIPHHLRPRSPWPPTHRRHLSIHYKITRHRSLDTQSSRRSSVYKSN